MAGRVGEGVSVRVEGKGMVRSTILHLVGLSERCENHPDNELRPARRFQ